MVHPGVLADALRNAEAETLNSPHRSLLLTLSLVTAAVLLNVSAPNVALPAIADDLGAGRSTTQWVISAYALALASALLTAGVLADRTGRRRVLLASVVVFLSASALAAAAPNVEVLIASRALQGLAAAGAFASSNAIIAETFTGRDRARALGIIGGTIALSFAIGPLLGGVMVELAGWRGLFVVNVVIGLAALVLARRRLPESVHPQPVGFDWTGTVLSASGLALVVLALSGAGDLGWTDPVVLAGMAAGIAILAVFLAIELRAVHPMLDPRLLARPPIALACVAAATSTIAAFCTTIFLTLFLIDGQDRSPLEAGLVLLPSALVAWPVALAAGALSARLLLGNRLALGLVLLSAGVLLLRAGVAADADLLALLPGLVALGAGAGVANPAISYAALSGASKAQAGLASGLNYTFRQVALAGGTAGLTSLLATEIADSPSAAEFAEALQPVLLICAVAPAAGALASLLLTRRVAAFEAAGAESG